MSKHLDVLVPITVLVVITYAMAYAVGIRFSPSWAALFPERPRAAPTLQAVVETPPKPKPQPWCERGKIVGGFCAYN
jgi:hypothetical protein